MTSHTLLDSVVASLEYRDAAGFVDAASTEPSARGFIWNDLRQKCEVDAAYFNGAVPVVAFAATESRHDALLLQRRLWNYGRVPVLIVTAGTEVLALSCNAMAGADDLDAALLGQATGDQELAQVMADFTRFSVESGRLTQLHADRLDKRNRIDQSLLRNLRLLRMRLLENDVTETDIEPLIGRSIFIRYMEDRGILRQEDLRDLGQPESFSSALEQGWKTTSAFFDAMSEHFNGDVFRRGVLIREVPLSALNVLSAFFQATDLDSWQQSFWAYDFSIIPPELISSIYEQLLESKQKSDAAYYTPRHVVDLVLDELLDPSWGRAEAKTLLDPACGSGIFLTEAFRRIVYANSFGRDEPPSFDELSTLLTSSIFGIDLNSDAIGVAAFGLYLALLEHVDPRTIWLTARLPDLIGTNLVASDFFDNHLLASKRFDAIVGNPPWKSQLSAAAGKYLAKAGVAVPDRQIAAAFMWRAVELLQDDGLVGLVLPAKTVLHNRATTADRFRLQFFGSMSVKTIIDLSPLRKELFDAAAPAMIAIFGRARAEDENTPILHVSPRRTPVAQIVDGIAIPQQNIRRVPRSAATTDPALWKPLLWGGPTDVDLVRHLRESFRPLRELVSDQGWVSSPGFQRGGGDANDATQIADLPFIVPRSVRAMRVETPDRAYDYPAEMHRPRRRDVYLAPHLLMRKGFSLFPEATFVGFDATFTDAFFGLAAPARDSMLLKAIAAMLNSSVARYWFFMTSSSWGVEREQLHPNEWLTVPIPVLETGVLNKLAKIVDQAASGLSETAWLPDLDSIVAAAFKLTETELLVIRDALDIRGSELRQGWRSQVYQPASDDYLQTFLAALRGDLEDLGIGRWSVRLTERSNGLVAVTCSVGGREVRSTPAQPSFSIAALLNEDAEHIQSISTATIIEPEAIVLEGESVHLIKPDRLSCWTISSTHEVAAEIFAAIVNGNVRADV